jgi:hypothetical protein
LLASAGSLVAVERPLQLAFLGQLFVLLEPLLISVPGDGGAKSVQTLSSGIAQLDQKLSGHHPILERPDSLAALANVSSDLLQAEVVFITAAVVNMSKDVEVQLELVSGCQLQQMTDRSLAVGTV